MKDFYPPSSIPAEFLVPPDLQPDYTDVPEALTTAATDVARAVLGAVGAPGRLKPDSPAIIHAESGRQYTFAELQRGSDVLAQRLVGLGVRPGDRVAYRSPNVPEFLVAALAIWKAGAVVVPTPAQARPAEFRHYLDDVQPRVLFLREHPDEVPALLEEAARAGVEHVLMLGPGAPDGVSAVWDGLLTETPHVRGLPLVDPDGVAIIWHTGGTTGRPKACYHTHRRFVLGGLALGRATGVQPGERWLAPVPIGHALGVIFHTLHTLLHGATAIIVEDFTQPEGVLEAISSHRVDSCAAITATWARLLAVAERRPDLDISGLRRGYAMWQSASSTDVREGWRARGIELLNNFGSTSFATWPLVPRAGEAFEDGSLGRALDGYTVEAVEVESGTVRPLPKWTIGRMAVRGPTGLTYWRNAEQQARDVVDGWTLVDDLVCFDDRGNAAYLGRTDFIISTAGNKVAPVEVEQALTSHPAVREAAVVGAPDDLRVEVVMAFVALEDGVEGDAALVGALQAHVKATLAPNKYPRRICFLTNIPRDPVGKVQHGLLKQWAADGPGPGTEPARTG